MKRIINMGKNVYKVMCTTCTCEFVYDDKEIEKETKTLPDGSHGLMCYVICPCCGTMIEHSSLNKLYCIKTSLNKQYGVKND